MSLKRLKQPVILNAAGNPIRLTRGEQFHADEMQRKINNRFRRLDNSLGYEVNITTLTTIMKKTTEQKFFEVPPADFFAVRVGEGTWSTNLTTYRAFDVAGTFEDGIVNTGGQNGRMASADAGVDSLNIRVFPWAKQVGWSIFDLQFAAKSGNWDVVTAKESARKKNWDLGVQRVAFLGARGLNAAGGACTGFLNQAGITVNTTLITKKISSMTTAELKVFCAGVLDAYRSNCNRTAWPTNFAIPESDFLGLASQASPDFPIKSTLQLLQEMFATMTGKPGFKIQSLAYADAAYHTDVAAIAGKQCYVLSSYDEASLRMDVPLDYTNTLANSLDNFSFQNVGYGQFTGVLAYRPLEMLYFRY